MSNNHGDIVIEAPAGYKWDEGTLTKITYVAEAGDVKYESLQKAIDAAKSKAVVTMLADTRENVTISKALTLDLNGFTLNGSTGERKAALKVDNATVTVKDSSANQTGTIKREDVEDPNVTGSNSYYVIDIQGGNGLLIFEGGNVTNTSGIVGVKGASLVRLGDDSVSARPTLTINGGTFTQDNFAAIKVDRGTLHFKGGTVNGKVNERNYNSLSASYENEQTELECRISELNAAIKTERENDENAVNFVDLIKQYTDIDELSQALLNTLIDRIEVHEPEDVDGELIQKLDVYYKFVGRLD